MIQRIRDYLHERAIARQGKILADICDHGTNADARREYAKLSKLVLARSPQQVRRMEDAMFKRLDPGAQRIFLESKDRESRQ